MKPVIVLISVFLLFGCAKEQAQKDRQQPDWSTEFKKQGLVLVNADSAGILVELKYATEDNFTGKKVYGNLSEAYLRPEALKKLLAANHMLRQEHPSLRLLIYDAARPRRIQRALWNSSDIPEEERSQYIANPDAGSIHNYGCAVDLTLADRDGNPLDMGTDFDNFTKTAHIDDEENLVAAGMLTTEQLSNRRLLRELMTKAGFLTISSEWWHFDAFSRQETTERFRIVE